MSQMTHSREPVIIERGDPCNGPGLPRPLAPNKGVLRPVPWTNDVEGWGLLHQRRAGQCCDNSLCLVCGEVVEEGFILTADEGCPVLVSQDDLHHAMDNGALHERCAKMTVAHCKHIRNKLHKAEAFMIRYRKGTA